MAEEKHWPFEDEAEKKGLHREDLKDQKGLHAQKAAYQHQMRNDRLLVGGRAHVKKSGLS